ncbi:hypothetical protein PAMP_015355 [Pampus punctatissimus]
MQQIASGAIKNFCSNSTVLRTRTTCHSCSISPLIPCPSGYKQTPGSVAKNCNYYIKTASLQLPISGCSFECYREVVVKSCCPGFWGADCIAVNPCLRQVCHVHATCVHSGPDQHLCDCNPGYSGDGRVCVAVDPCQIKHGGCSTTSTRCIYDGPGKSHCECLPGFDNMLDSVSCSLKDSCRPDSCHKDANCTTVGPGRVECTCFQGYLGNGKECYGNIMQRLKDLNTQPGGQWSGQLSNAIALFDSLSWQLQNLGPFTVFVPINKGFRGTSVRTLTADSSKAKYLCKMHMVAGVMPFDSLKKSSVFYTLTGKSAETDTSEGDTQTKIRIHGSRKKGVIIQSDVVAYNGMIHIINKLMDSVSPTVESDTEENLMKIISDYGKFDKFKTLLDGLNKLVEFLRNHIISSTSLEVYNAVSSPRIVTMANQVLTINVTENGQILVDKAAVLEAAVEAKNGRLYVLDGVLTPPSIEPVLPHRCDITESKIIKGECVSCSKLKLLQCSSGVYTGSSTFGCVYTFTLGRSAIPVTGCSPHCNTTVTTRACCKGFFGSDCRPCPGGYQMPCSGHGQCLEGVEGNGTCICQSNFRGSRCQFCSSSNKFGPNCDRTCPCIHGQCDNRPDSDGRCKVDSCLMGFTGSFCDRRTTACGIQAQFCHAHADCDFSNGAARCVCKPGYQGDGITCVESDSCAPPLRGGCSVNAKCIKTGPGTHFCQCLTGWEEDGDNCQPINNCNAPNKGDCHPNATCIYVGPGQSDCTCKAGYKGNGRDCEAVNQCVTENGGCHYLASCRLLSFQWTCVCDDGYDGNGHICYGTIEQELIALPETSEFFSWTTITAVGGATITTSNVAATNGLIHIIDKVLIPDRKLSEGLLATLALRPEFSLFRSYLIEYNLTDEIEQADEFTIFAPTDAAVNDYLKEMAATALDVNTTRYHLVASERLLNTDLQSGGYKKTLLGFSFELGIYPRDGQLFVNSAQINIFNILSGKGVIHGLSAVLQINRNRCDEAKYQKVMVRKCCSGFFGKHCEPCPGPKGQSCFGNGACLDGTNGTGVCQCNKGFNGTACETCQSGKYGVHCDQDCGCKNGRCKDGLKGDGTCKCDIGWRGVLCDQKIESRADELCGSVTCHTSANCVIRANHPQCLCAAGFEGNGTFCQVSYLCTDIFQENGGCHVNAKCNMTGPGVRTCRCAGNFVGDGLTCRGTVGKEILTRRLRDFYLGLMMVEISLKGRGPFTVFVPNNEAFAADRNGDGKMRALMSDKYKQLYAAVLRSHIVMCHTLLPADLSQPRNLTTLSGLVLTTTSSQGSIFINQAAVTYSDGVSVNGILHEIDRILFPPNMDKEKQPDVTLNLTDVAEQHGYRNFYKLLQDTGVIDLVHDVMYQPVTIFLPSDSIMASLPQEQKDFLFHQDNRAQLMEYLKYHILLSQKVYSEGLIYLDMARTLQGSPLSFSCGGTDDIGEIFVNDEKCRITQRHLVFNEGIAYGIDCLLTPPSLGGRCDSQVTFDYQLSCGLCTHLAARCPTGSKLKDVEKCDLPTAFVTRNTGCRSICTINIWKRNCCHGYHGRDCLVCPGGVGSPCSNHGKCDDGRLGNGTCTCDAGFGGVACELCRDGFYGPNCKACNCSGHGSCDVGRKGTGLCFCEAGWTGEHCEMQQGIQVNCTCPKTHSGDGFTCLPIDPCVAGDNGGCHVHATCTMTAPGKKKCLCKDNYIGDGLTCEVKQLPISRCLQDNGQCHQDAKCTDLHFEGIGIKYEYATLGVFHYRSVNGQYKLNYSVAQQACSAEGGSLATYTQLSYAQQGGLNMCAAGWLDQARVAYPTTYSNPNCGFGHVGIVDYGTRKNLSETWDTFCYRVKEVKCECKLGYVGDGFSCTGNLLQVLRSTPTFSNFLTQILNYSQVSESGKQFVNHLSNLTVQSMLFVPDNSGLSDNQTLSQWDIEFHLSEGQALRLSQLKNGSRISTRVGSLTVSGVSNLLDPSALSSCYINDRFVTGSDILASNGIIHVLQGPLKAPPPREKLHVAHKAGMGVGVVLLIALVVGVIFVGYHFYKHNIKPFQFHYFKEDEVPPTDCSRSISNPVYEAAPEPAESNTSDDTEEDKHEVVNGGSYDLLQDS